MLTVYVTYCAVMAILAVAAIWCAVMNRRHPGPPSRLGQVLEADRLDRMAAEQRDEQPCNLAWPPEVEPPPLVEKLPPRIARDDCGCLWLQGGLWSPCRIHDTGVLADYIDANADTWAAGLTEGDDQ